MIIFFRWLKGDILIQVWMYKYIYMFYRYVIACVFYQDFINAWLLLTRTNGSWWHNWSYCFTVAFMALFIVTECAFHRWPWMCLLSISCYRSFIPKTYSFLKSKFHLDAGLIWFRVDLIDWLKEKRDKDKNDRQSISQQRKTDMGNMQLTKIRGFSHVLQTGRHILFHKWTSIRSTLNHINPASRWNLDFKKL
jgi:hypothetical protein